MIHVFVCKQHCKQTPLIQLNVPKWLVNCWVSFPVASLILIWICLTLSVFLSTAVTFTDEEKEQMRKFTNRSYVLDKATKYNVWLNLVDIILAYVYDVRTTEGEHNVSATFVYFLCETPIFLWFGGKMHKIKGWTQVTGLEALWTVCRAQQLNHTITDYKQRDTACNKKIIFNSHNKARIQ